jgi:Na+/proline symporter
MVGPMVAAKLLGLTGAVIVFIVVFAALASSLDSLLAATSDLITQDIYKGHIRPGASQEELRKVARMIILLLGVVTWLLCLPRLTTLGELLFFMGAFVASTIWPIIAGLYWKSTNPTGAMLAMTLGTVAGLTAYFEIGFYVAALVSTAVSMFIVIISTWLWPLEYDWINLNEATQQ